MSQEVWERVYADAWRLYYTDEHVATVMRRAVLAGINRTKLLDLLVMFSGAVPIEGVHPLQFGFVRRKIRTQRRHGMPIVNPILFYPRADDAVYVANEWAMKALHYRGILKRVVSSGAPDSWFDKAMQPSNVEGGDHLIDVFVE